MPLNAEQFRNKYHNDLEWRMRKRKRDTKWRRKNAENLRMKRDEIFGKICKICKSTKRLCLHKKDGRAHYTDQYTLKKALENPQEWVRLCRYCHDGVHWCMKYLGWEYNTIVSQLVCKSAGADT